jgi:proteic killer suppression protein
VILEFLDSTTEDIYNGDNTKAARKLPETIWPAARRKLDMLNAAGELKDLVAPPGNRLEALAGRLSGFHSIRINDQFRLVFKFNDGNATGVRITDYH